MKPKNQRKWKILKIPFESFHNSFDEKTPVAKIVSLQTTPLYGLWFPPVEDKYYICIDFLAKCFQYKEHNCASPFRFRSFSVRLLLSLLLLLLFVP